MPRAKQKDQAQQAQQAEPQTEANGVRRHGHDDDDLEGAAQPAPEPARQARSGARKGASSKARAKHPGSSDGTGAGAGAVPGTTGSHSRTRQTPSATGAAGGSPSSASSDGASSDNGRGKPALRDEVVTDADGSVSSDLFLEHQKELLLAERNNYTRQAAELKAQAEALALEHEPGDVQFDEEGGEGGTANVDREIDLHLSAQAQAAIDEIDAALAKIAAGTYGLCESCGRSLPAARLEALPHARLCVSCKSGGLSARKQ